MTPNLHAVEFGHHQSPALVFLHGFGGCAALWQPIAEALRDRHRILAYDLPGHGGSLAWPNAGAAKLAADAIIADLDRRGLRSVHLVGHSMGGAVATLIATAIPARTASLTLLAPGGFGPEINAPLLRRYGSARTAEEIRNCLGEMSGPQTPDVGKAVAVLAAMRAVPGQTEKLAEIAAVITRNDRQGVIPREWLAGLVMPVEVVWGTDDPMLPFAQFDGLPSNMRRHSVPGVGHMLAEEAPGLVIETIERQLAGAA